MAFLKFIFFFLIAVFVIRMIARPLMAFFFTRLEKKMRSNFTQQEEDRPKGDITIEDVASNDDDYTEYEEIK